MSLHRGSLVAVLLAALLNGVAALADEAPGSAPAEPATQIQSTEQVPPATRTTASPAQAAPPAPALVPSTSTLQPAAGAPVARPVAGTSTSNMVSGLLFLVALILGAAWLIKRTGGMPALRGGSSMKVIAALSLGPRERVVLIELGGQQWLLGVGGGSVNTLHHFEQPIITGGNDDFAGKLRQLWPQGVGK
jgi:flagellar protein FliO/FliZ